MKLDDKFTAEQIMAAKKTITIATEIEGETHSESFDGTKGLAVLYQQDDLTISRLMCDHVALAKFATSLLEDIFKNDPIMLLPIIQLSTGGANCTCEKCQSTTCN